jgi:retron-type reverse transcriptase
MKDMSYRPSPARKVMRPKDTKGVFRPLGISNLEDKIVQKMLARVLESVFDPIFLNCSYGFRQGMGCHDAIRDLYQYLFTQRVENVVDVDIENFFGTIGHQVLQDAMK